MTAKRKIPISAWVDETKFEEFKEYCSMKKVSMSSILRERIDRLLHFQKGINGGGKVGKK